MFQLQPLKTYDLKYVTLIVGGMLISGYGEEGGIEFEYSQDIGEVTASADGSPTFSRFNNGIVLCTITVRESSDSYRDLGMLLNAQQLQMEIQPLPFLMNDLINGDNIADQYAVFVQRPGLNKAQEVGDRSFVLALPTAAHTILYGPSA